MVSGVRLRKLDNGSNSNQIDLHWIGRAPQLLPRQHGMFKLRIRLLILALIPLVMLTCPSGGEKVGMTLSAAAKRGLDPSGVHGGYCLCLTSI